MQPGFHDPDLITRKALDDDVNVLQLLRTLRRRLPLVVVVGTVLAWLVSAVADRFTTEFRSRARMHLGELERHRTDPMGLMKQSRQNLNTEIALLTSDTIVEKAVLAAGTNVQLGQRGWQRPNYGQWRKSGRDHEYLDLPSQSILVTDAKPRSLAQGARTYRIMFNDAKSFHVYGEDGHSQGVGRLGRVFRGKDVTMRVRRGLLQRPSRDTEYRVTVRPVAATAARARERLKIIPLRMGKVYAKVIVLAYGDTTPRRAAQFLTHLMETFLATRQAWHTEHDSAAEEYADKRLLELSQGVAENEEERIAYRQEHLPALSMSTAEDTAWLRSRYESDRLDAQQLIEKLQGIKRLAREGGHSLEALMLGESSDAVLLGLARSLSRAQAQLSDARSRHAERSSHVRNLKRQLRAQVTAVANYVDSRIERARAQVRELDEIIANAKDELGEVPQIAAELEAIERDSEVLESLQSKLLRAREQLEIKRASTLSRNRILDPATIEQYESSPRGRKPRLVGVAGYFLVALLVVAWAFFSPVVRSDEEARDLLGGIPVLTRVPAETVRSRVADALLAWLQEPGWKPSKVPKQTAALEAFRVLRTNLYDLLRSDHGSVLLVSSPAPRDGKTRCVAGLAAALTANQKRTLVIDANLRRPGVHKLHKLSLRPGLSEVMRGTHTWQDTIRTVATPAGEYSVITAGAGVLETSASDLLVRFLVEARARYDFVLIDSPAHPAAADALVLLPLVDCTLTVIRIGSTDRRLVADHFRGFLGRGLRYGVILNSDYDVQPNLGWLGAMRRAGVARATGLLRSVGRYLDEWTQR